MLASCRCPDKLPEELEASRAVPLPLELLLEELLLRRRGDPADVCARAVGPPPPVGVSRMETLELLVEARTPVLFVCVFRIPTGGEADN